LASDGPRLQWLKAGSTHVGEGLILIYATRHRADLLSMRTATSPFCREVADVRNRGDDCQAQSSRLWLRTLVVSSCFVALPANSRNTSTIASLFGFCRPSPRARAA
ncbi:hypothetical protein, partial [Streptomyces sp. NPDC058548]|uniref:hypothetical protein n=1 Tax=Streptomyces sp. NPDC058548 TaxID=3346545 RepID=UPI0036525868